MGILSQSTLLAWFDFGVAPLTQFFNIYNTYHAATDGSLIVGFGMPELHANASMITFFKDGPIGRHSYGRYLDLKNSINAPPTDHYLSTFGDANHIAHYHRTAWTVAVLFRDRDVTQIVFGGTGHSLVAKGNAGFAVPVHSVRILVKSDGSIEFMAGGTTGGTSTTIILAAGTIVSGITYIAYLSKTDAGAMDVGVKQVDTGSWVTGTSAANKTVVWDTAKDLYINANLDAGGLGLTNYGPVDYGQACWWYSALTPEAIQLGIENHFGIANPAGGGGSGGAQVSFLSGGGLS